MTRKFLVIAIADSHLKTETCQFFHLICYRVVSRGLRRKEKATARPGILITTSASTNA